MKKREKDSKIQTTHIRANHLLCTSCGRCITACSSQVIKKAGYFWHRHIVIKNEQDCTGCKNCIQVCPRGVFSENISDAIRNMVYQHS